MKNNKGQKKVLFVDVDGVLIDGDWGNFRIANPVKVDQLNRVTTATGAKIVLSSAWRMYGHTLMSKVFKKWGVREPILDVTPDFGKLENRGIEIQHWLDRNRDVTRFAIVDDNSWMNHLTPYLVQTDFDHGLTARKANELIRMLKHGPKTIPLLYN